LKAHSQGRHRGAPGTARRSRHGWWVLLAVLTLALAALTAAGCGDDDDDGGGGGTADEGAALKKVGKGEGQVNLIAWAGYVEDGSTDPNVDWVSDFEKETGCQVNVKLGNTSDEMVTLMRTGKYDGVSASGDATLRLIAGGDVAPVNTDLIPNYADVFEGLKDQPHNTVDGVNYGVPHGRGANLLMFNKDVVKPAPDSWSVVWGGDESQPYKGKITAYDSPIYIADAAVYLKATEPDLGIDNVYELDDKQFQAAVDLLKQQREVIGEYWSDYTKEQAAFTSGDSVAGTTWQVIANLVQADKKSPPVEAILPKEGSTGWSDTWMISSEAKHPNCMYKWMDHIISPQANAAVAEWFGEAPANEKSCALTENKDHCAIFHADDEDYFDQVAYWTTPRKECGDDRGSTCKDYSEWVKAWTEIKG
jgi:putative spermidine/putrescine transport system substrate-binding protein